MLRVTLVMSPSLFITRTSSEDLVFMEAVVDVTESVNCFGVREPVLDRVTILLASANISNACKIYFQVQCTILLINKMSNLNEFFWNQHPMLPEEETTVVFSVEFWVTTVSMLSEPCVPVMGCLLTANVTRFPSRFTIKTVLVCGDF